MDKLEIERDHFNGDYIITVPQKTGKVQTLVVLWFTPDELTEFTRRLVQETADPGIEPTLV